MSMTSVGLNAQISALIHGTTATKPTQPIRLTASASGWLRAMAMRPGRPSTNTASAEPGKDDDRNRREGRIIPEIEAKP